jgi:DNA repair exonuclease SbcCD ATPase subunit
MSTGMWILILAATALCAGLALLWRGADVRAQEQAAANEKLSAEREDLKTRLARESQGRKKQADELASLRKRADKSKKRQSKTAPGQPMGITSRIGDLESELERTIRERNQGQVEREQLSAQVAQLQTRLKLSAEAADAAQSALVPVPPPPVVAPGVEELQSQLAEQAERLAKLENQLGQAKMVEARVRKRMNNQEQLYASVRAELDVKKDRLRTQEEQLRRLEAMKVVVGD